MGGRYNRTEEDGQPVSYKDHPIGKVIHAVYTEQGYDPIRVWMTLAKENGMRPWLSFRMNDVHYANEPLMHREFFYTARDNGWMIGDTSPRRLLVRLRTGLRRKGSARRAAGLYGGDHRELRCLRH